MTITYHAQKRMQERLIPEEIVNKTIAKGKKMFKNNRLLYRYNIYVVVADMENTTVVTVHYISKINRILQDISEKFDITISDAINDYLKYIV